MCVRVCVCVCVCVLVCVRACLLFLNENFTHSLVYAHKLLKRIAACIAITVSAKML